MTYSVHITAAAEQDMGNASDHIKRKTASLQRDQYVCDRRENDAGGFGCKAVSSGCSRGTCTTLSLAQTDGGVREKNHIKFVAEIIVMMKKKKKVWNLFLFVCCCAASILFGGVCRAEAEEVVHAHEKESVYVSSLWTVYAKIELPAVHLDFSGNVFYVYTSVTAKVGNEEYEMSLSEESGSYKSYEINFPNAFQLNEQITFTAICSCGKSLTKTAAFNNEECSWGKITYYKYNSEESYSATASLSLMNQASWDDVTAYKVVNGEITAVEIEHRDVEFPMNYSPGTEIEACIVINGRIYAKKYVMPNFSPSFSVKKIRSTDRFVSGMSKQNGTVFVQANGKTNSQKCKAYEEYSVPLPRVYAGMEVTVTAKTDLGHTAEKVLTAEQGKSNVKIAGTVHCADGFVKVYGNKCQKDDKMTVLVSGKTYEKKLTSNAEQQYVTVKVGEMKKNAVITAALYDAKGNLKGSGKAKVKVLESYVVLTDPIIRTTTRIGVNASHLQKGDKIELKVGGHTYAKKAVKDTKKGTFDFQISATGTGAKVAVTVYDKYGNVKGKMLDKVYYDTEVWIGMPENLIKLTIWGKPDNINYYGSNVPEQWVYYYGSRTMYVYVQNGKIQDIQDIYTG